jgi:hypothetical protein
MGDGTGTGRDLRPWAAAQWQAFSRRLADAGVSTPSAPAGDRRAAPAVHELTRLVGAALDTHLEAHPRVAAPEPLDPEVVAAALARAADEVVVGAAAIDAAGDPAVRASWAGFCATLATASAVLTRPGSPTGAVDVAEGLRYLSRLIGMSVDTCLEHGDPAHPRLYNNVHATRKYALDSPDNVHHQAAVSGAHRYVLRGHRGSCAYLSFGTYAGSYLGRDGMRTIAHKRIDEFDVAADGTFELHLSVEPAAENWLPLAPDASLLIVRQARLDHEHEQPAALRIERVDPAGIDEPPPFDTRAALDAAATMVVATSELFAELSERWQTNPNAFTPMPRKEAGELHGNPEHAYFPGAWRLAPDEALVIELEPPPCAYWGIQVCNHWTESLDHRFHPISANGHRVAVDEHGTARMVLAHRDPRVGTWLSTAGHERGLLHLRVILGAHWVEPRTTVVPIDELRRRAS